MSLHGASPAGMARQAAAPDVDDYFPSYYWLLASSVRMIAVREAIERVAPTDAIVLITGESGTGKEIVARTVHERSPRRRRPFIKVNCAALPGELLESELLGYERGAFTGAARSKPGKFELADGGTIFLDEVGEIPLHLQAKLLQVLQDREFAPLGSLQDIRIDVRVLAATNKDLPALVTRGDFREDLYYRLNVMHMEVPPLRERREEIPALTAHFLDVYATRYGRVPRRPAERTMCLFMEYAWPGNVRELENFVKRMVLLDSEDWVEAELASSPPVRRQRPEPEAFAPPDPQLSPVGGPAHPHGPATVGNGQTNLKEIVRRAAYDAERSALSHVLNAVHWHRGKAARLLGISYKTLLLKIKEHGLEVIMLAVAIAS